MERKNPKKIYIFSGKRKSGKDYFTDFLYKRLDPEAAVIIRLSEPIKSYWSKTNALSLNKLLGADEYKEAYREAMVKWGEKIRKEDYGYFCRAAIEMCKAEEKPIWIISDARRKTDIKWFREEYGDIISTFKIYAEDEVRKDRGWKFTIGIDDKETECDLDDYFDWTEVVNNSGNIEDLEPVISRLVQDINSCLTAKKP